MPRSTKWKPRVSFQGRFIVALYVDLVDIMIVDVLMSLFTDLLVGGSHGSSLGLQQTNTFLGSISTGRPDYCPGIQSEWVRTPGWM